MSYTLHQLDVFASVAKNRSFTKAAKELFMSQPAVSIQVKKLQEHFEIDLVEVIGKQLHLTEAGIELYNSHKKITNELKNLDMALTELKGVMKGKLSIVAVSTAKYFMPYILGEFRNEFPQVQISLKVTDRIEVTSLLKENSCDLAVFSQLPDEMSLEYVEFLSNPLVLAASPKHDIANKKNIQWKELEEFDFLIRETGSGTRLVMENLFNQENINPEIVMELSTNEAVKQAIMAGIGISLVSRYSLINEEKMGKISVLDVEGLPYVNNWKLVYPKGKKLSPVARSFIQFSKTKDIHAIIG
ncbi:LysR family transcriptional regulator [Rhodohalobacter barkolensis]|uniref:LysR family transcriptional regulator n=1 Tax=Rhodohalobacter barkolensis TaxID=2053187 RepID=A0A2N0VM21_9BACT|nr:LysR family transcriptional regulator [Rhodohalobacter barkolensis]PKD45209.1 LysR family transcriptional regulator [Rhodohalobacter barkolensis]